LLGEQVQHVPIGFLAAPAFGYPFPERLENGLAIGPESPAYGCQTQYAGPKYR
jgi:hypothetical protein